MKEPVVDRAARDRVADLLESYLREDIGSFDFDEALQSVETEDPTLNEIILCLWCCYDDFVDHKVHVNKEGWNCFQRLLLLLRSDGVFEEGEVSRRWTIRQALAGAGLVAFGLCAALLSNFGLIHYIWVACLPLGALSMGLSRWSSREDERRCEHIRPLAPFASGAEILKLHRRLPGFKKRQYPRHLEDRRIRGPVAEFIMFLTSLPWYGLWLIFSPLALLFQIRPEKETSTGVSAS